MTISGKKLLWAFTLLLATTVSVSAQEKLDPIHEHLAQFAGEFSTVTRFSMKAGDQAMESTGTAKITSILGGRFLQEESSGMMMGQKFTSVKLTGYNSGAERFESSWVYTGSTSIMTLTGTSPDGGKTINWEGTFEMQKGQKQTLYVESKYPSKDRFVVTLFTKNPDGSKGSTFETTYTRKK